MASYTIYKSSGSIYQRNNDTNTVVNKGTAGTSYASPGNDKTCIQDTANIIAAQGGGLIILSAGTYYIGAASPFDIGSNTILSGSTSSANDTHIVGETSARILGKTNVTIQNITFRTHDSLYYGAFTGQMLFIESTASVITSNINVDNCVFKWHGHYCARIGTDLELPSIPYGVNNVTFTDCVFKECGYGGLNINPRCSYITVDNCTFTDINFRDVTESVNYPYGNAYGVAVTRPRHIDYYSHHIFIRNSHFENIGVWEGIDSHGADWIEIDDCTFVNIGKPIAIHHQNDSGTYRNIQHVRIRRNNIDNTNYTKVGGLGYNWTGIYVLGILSGGVSYDYDDVEISGNTFHGCGDYVDIDGGSIFCEFCKNITIKDNIIHDTGGYGIGLNSVLMPKIHNNEINGVRLVAGNQLGMKFWHEGALGRTTAEIYNVAYANGGTYFANGGTTAVTLNYDGSQTLYSLTSASWSHVTITPPEPIGDIKVKVNGTWVVPEIKVKVDGSWVACAIKVKINGSWITLE